MIYDHIVVTGGKYYAAGENVPDEILNGNGETLLDESNEEEEAIDAAPAKRGRPKKTQE